MRRHDTPARHLPAAVTTPYACTTYYRLKPHVKILTDTAKILFRYLKNPRQMGTVCPSSRFLAKKMVSGINRKCGVIVELGPGTGAITKHLVDSGLAKDCKLYCIEFDSSLIPHLERKFPSAKIVNGSAEDLRDIVGADTARICAVVSSLPLISLPQRGRAQNTLRSRSGPPSRRQIHPVHLQPQTQPRKNGLRKNAPHRRLKSIYEHPTRHA